MQISTADASIASIETGTEFYIPVKDGKVSYRAEFTVEGVFLGRTHLVITCKTNSTTYSVVNSGNTN